MSSASNAIGPKAPSTKRCIKTSSNSRGGCLVLRQKAPSSIRCIKTDHCRGWSRRSVAWVRKRRAPKGALRQACLRAGNIKATLVRKHERQKVH